MERIICHLEKGTAVNKFFWKKPPERRILAVKMETFQIVWYKPMSKENVIYEGAIDLREVKEIRPGRNSKNFDRWPDHVSRFEENHWFTVFYGSEFLLKILSIETLFKNECDLWMKGLLWLNNEALIASYPLQLERWMRKELSYVACERSTTSSVTLKDVKTFLSKVNCQMAKQKLVEAFQEVDNNRLGEIKFEEFASLYHNLIYDDSIFQAYFFKYSADGKIITQSEFEAFLTEQQGEFQITTEEESKAITDFMRDFVRDPIRNMGPTYFTIKEFMCYLFSQRNKLWDKKHSVVNQDMTQPLSHYWISSSHNTYLTGNQFSSNSSIEAYARCLRMGCRCIEMDCWDGPDGAPIIYHGRTMTSKIRFLDVVETIKEHAFTTSDFPVILSIEDHCSLPQQRMMAKIFVEVLGPMLLTIPVGDEAYGTALPSPMTLRHKIILKHQKLPEDSNGVSIAMEEKTKQSSSQTKDIGRDIDLSNTEKNGILLMEDQMKKEWVPHFFVLTQSKMFYTEVPQEENDSEGTDDDDSELYICEEWFHDKLTGGRDSAKELLVQYGPTLGDGTFLVRKSETFVGDFSLSFWHTGQVHHCHIHTHQDEWGKISYYFIEPEKCYDSLNKLIMYYKLHSLKIQGFSIMLNQAVPQSINHESKDWYHPSVVRAKAEEILRSIRRDGAFLVRPSDSDINTYSISFRAEGKIKHCRTKQQGQLFIIGTAQFKSLIDLVSYYEKHPLYRKVCLRYPVTKDIVKQLDVNSQQDEEEANDYMDPEVLSGSADGMPLGSLQKGSFDVKGAVVEMIDLAPPASQPTVSDTISTTENISLSTNSFQKVPKYLLRIKLISKTQPVIELGVDSKDEAIDWCNTIRSVEQRAADREKINKDNETTWSIAKELSDLIIYCIAVPFNQDCLKRDGLNPNEMSSFHEQKAEKIMLQEYKFFLWYHQVMLSRIFPKGQRLDSSNYFPVPFWNIGSQMVALNYQTPDKNMQINEAKFMQNGRCGYVLKPSFMLKSDFNPNYTRTPPQEEEPLILVVKIIAARHLTNYKRRIVCSYVEMEVIGTPHDMVNNKYSTKIITENGFNPVWNETFELDISCPSLAILRFAVYDIDMFGDANLIAQATYPALCLRRGFRSVPLKNGHSEPLELASLLVHLDARKLKIHKTDVESSFLLYREELRDIQEQITEAKDRGDAVAAEEAQNQFRVIEKQILQSFAESNINKASLPLQTDAVLTVQCSTTEGVSSNSSILRNLEQ